jgi:hypothetical protein
MNDTFEAGKRVASRLFPSEKLIDDSLLANLSLQVALIEARRTANQPFATVQKALEESAAASTALVEARRATGRVHATIVRMRSDLGLPPTGYGCEVACIGDQQEPPMLKSVPNAA